MLTALEDVLYGRRSNRWSMPPQPDQLRDGIIDLPRSDWLEKTNEQGSNRLKSGSKSNSIGAEHNEAIRTPHHALAWWQFSPTTRVHSLARAITPDPFDPVQNTEKFQGLRINARTDTAFSFSRLLPALPSQQGSPCQSHLSGKDRSAQ